MLFIFCLTFIQLSLFFKNKDVYTFPLAFRFGNYPRTLALRGHLHVHGTVFPGPTWSALSAHSSVYVAVNGWEEDVSFAF